MLLAASLGLYDSFDRSPPPAFKLRSHNSPPSPHPAGGVAIFLPMTQLDWRGGSQCLVMILVGTLLEPLLAGTRSSPKRVLSLVAALNVKPTCVKKGGCLGPPRRLLSSRSLPVVRKRRCADRRFVLPFHKETLSCFFPSPRSMPLAFGPLRKSAILIIVAVVCLCCSTVVSAVPCRNFATCGTCVRPIKLECYWDARRNFCISLWDPTFRLKDTTEKCIPSGQPPSDDGGLVVPSNPQPPPTPPPTPSPPSKPLCSAFVTCASCKASGNGWCGWCDSGKVCVSGTTTVSASVCASNQYFYNTCPVVDCYAPQYAACESCASAGCPWCASLRTCGMVNCPVAVVTSAAACTTARSFKFCDYTQCVDCVSDSICAWCDRTTYGTCVLRSGSPCLNTKTSTMDCTTCYYYTSCSTCLSGHSQREVCSWCPASKRCVPTRLSSFSQCAEWSTALQQCSERSSTNCDALPCDQCVMSSQCGWCASSNSCQRGEDSGSYAVGGCSGSHWNYWQITLCPTTTTAPRPVTPTVTATATTLPPGPDPYRAPGVPGGEIFNETLLRWGHRSNETLRFEDAFRFCREFESSFPFSNATDKVAPGVRWWRLPSVYELHYLYSRRLLGTYGMHAWSTTASAEPWTSGESPRYYLHHDNGGITTEDAKVCAGVAFCVREVVDPNERLSSESVFIPNIIPATASLDLAPFRSQTFASVGRLMWYYTDGIYTAHTFDTAAAFCATLQALTLTPVPWRIPTVAELLSFKTFMGVDSPYWKRQDCLTRFNDFRQTWEDYQCKVVPSVYFSSEMTAAGARWVLDGSSVAVTTVPNDASLQYFCVADYVPLPSRCAATAMNPPLPTGALSLGWPDALLLSPDDTPLGSSQIANLFITEKTGHAAYYITKSLQIFIVLHRGRSGVFRGWNATLDDAVSGGLSRHHYAPFIDQHQSFGNLARSTMIPGAPDAFSCRDGDRDVVFRPTANDVNSSFYTDGANVVQLLHDGELRGPRGWPCTGKTFARDAATLRPLSLVISQERDWLNGTGITAGFPDAINCGGLFYYYDAVSVWGASSLPSCHRYQFGIQWNGSTTSLALIFDAEGHPLNRPNYADHNCSVFPELINSDSEVIFSVIAANASCESTSISSFYATRRAFNLFRQNDSLVPRYVAPPTVVATKTPTTSTTTTTTTARSAMSTAVPPSSSSADAGSQSVVVVACIVAGAVGGVIALCLFIRKSRRSTGSASLSSPSVSALGTNPLLTVPQ